MSAPAARRSILNTTAPLIEEAEAAALVRRTFGISGRAHLLTSERDKNFQIVADDGRAFVLKVTNAAEDPSVSNFQTSALRHIEAMAPDLPVPKVWASIEGQYETVVRIAAGSRHIVRLLTYLPGEPLYRSEPSLAQARNLGRCLASIGLALKGFRHPGAAHDILWDLKGAARLRPYLVHIADDGRRALADEGLSRFETTILPALRGYRAQVVHNDFNPHNVLVDPGDPARVTGVLDFGDMVETSLVNDVAVAASYQIEENEDPLGRAIGFVASYHSVYPLRPEEIEVLFDLITLRQIMTVTITEWRATLYPDNKTYILRNQPRAAAALEILNRIGRAEGTSRLRQACQMEN
jgi:hydroxylysine kinase